MFSVPRGLFIEVILLKKAIFTLCVDNYFPELCEITIPNHKEYAKKIGADFFIIKDRFNREWPPTYEKTQIYDLGKTYDWSIHLDADLLIHPQMWDVTSADLSCIKYYSIYDPRLYFAPNKYFFRDSRLIGICSSFIAVPILCRDMWEPFECSFDVASRGIDRVHGVDDYCFSVNFAKFGMRGDFIFKEGDPLDYIQHLCVGGSSENKAAILQKAASIAANYPMSN